MSTQPPKDVETRVEEKFPAGIAPDGEIVSRHRVGFDKTEPSFREKQKKAIVELAKGIEDPETDVVLLNAPTGAGKSLILNTAASVTAGSSFIATPLNTLVDQMDNDPMISPSILSIKGRNNYDCIHPEDRGTPVDEAVCQRDSSFDCEMKDECPYYGRKKAALSHPQVVTNMAYLLAEGMIPDDVEGTLGDRAKLFIDECQNIESSARSFIQFTVSRYTVPDDVWNNIRLPPKRDCDDLDKVADWVRNELLDQIDATMEALRSIPVLDEEESSEMEELQQFRLRVMNFLDDFEDNEWVTDRQQDFRKNKPDKNKLVFEPVFIGRFLKNLLWNRGETVVLSSATIPGKGWLDEMGLDDANVKKINLGSTFPLENRRIICNLDVGKMVSERSDGEDNRETNAWPMAKRIINIAKHHEGEKGMIHCRSYSIMKLLRRQMINHDTIEVNGEVVDTQKFWHDNCMEQDRYNRDESLEEWIESDKQVFFSVAMDEGVDLKGDKCRWQVLAKVLYPFMTEMMKRRKEIADESGRSQDFWNYYNRQAAIQIQQAYGRGVRSKDDHCVFYILDSSAVQNQGLIQMNAELFNSWFLEAIEGLNVNSGRGM